MRNCINSITYKKSININKKVYESSDTEKYVYELKDNRYIETVFY